MRTLVTGGAGFIGSHLVDALRARGDDVTVVDDLSGGRESNLAEALEGARLARADAAGGGPVAHVCRARARVGLALRRFRA
jgi:nucleoside-diphosphate-sugar epimerase